MPNAQGKFLGQGWSRKKAESWERIFAPVPSPRTGNSHAYDLTREERQGVMRMVEQMKP